MDVQDGLIDLTEVPLDELLAATADTALGEVLERMVREEIAQAPQQTVSRFSSAL